MKINNLQKWQKSFSLFEFELQTHFKKCIQRVYNFTYFLENIGNFPKNVENFDTMSNKYVY